MTDVSYLAFQASIAGDSDLAGPIVFAVAFGSFIMFSGKLYFNYIYGIGLLGCLAMYSLLNLMSVAGVSLTCVVSVLGYCLLPIVGLSGVSILFSLSGFLGNILTGAAVTWCALSSSKVREWRTSDITCVRRCTHIRIGICTCTYT